MATTIGDLLDTLTVTGDLYKKLSDDMIECYACGHRCLIKEGKRGICKVRFNEGGHLRVPTNYVAALACDPTEKKPFFHALPGSDTLTFGMLGCDLHCGYCQNWLTSQALRDGIHEIRVLGRGAAFRILFGRAVGGYADSIVEVRDRVVSDDVAGPVNFHGVIALE